MIEIWKDVIGFEGLYQVSNLGRIKSLIRNQQHKKDRILKPCDNSHGYLRVLLYKDNKNFTRTVHRLVAIAFIPKPTGKKQVNHIDGIKQNNESLNLEWITASQNIKHAYDMRLKAKPYGVLNSQAKLTLELVSKIKNDTRKYKEIAFSFGIHLSTVKRIKYGKSWVQCNV